MRDVFRYYGLLGTMPCYHDNITDNACNHGNNSLNRHTMEFKNLKVIFSTCVMFSFIFEGLSSIAISSRRITKRHSQLSGSMSTSKKTHRRYRWPMPITESATACSITVSSRRPKSNTHVPRHCSLRAEIMRFIRKDSFWDCRKITKERSA